MMKGPFSWLQPMLARVREMQQGRPSVPTGAMPIMPIQAPPIAQNMNAPTPQMSKRRSLLTAQASMGGRYGRLAKDLLG
jgi:hypothetical protein